MKTPTPIPSCPLLSLENSISLFLFSRLFFFFLSSMFSLRRGRFGRLFSSSGRQPFTLAGPVTRRQIALFPASSCNVFPRVLTLDGLVPPRLARNWLRSSSPCLCIVHAPLLKRLFLGTCISRNISNI